MSLDLSRINRHSAEPLYQQIRTLLQGAIEQGHLEAHQQAPSERELSELTGVSRMTVRQALQQLVNEGWLYTVPGKGTFVGTDPKIEQNLQRLTGFTEEVQSQGFTPGSNMLQAGIVPAGEREAEVFGILPGTALIRICRQRLVNGIPIAVETAHLVQAAFPGIEALQFDRHSLYEVLAAQYGITPQHAIQIIEADSADEGTATMLEIHAGDPVLRMERITYGDDDRAVEYVLSTYRADRSRLRVELRVGQPLGAGMVQNVIHADGDKVTR